MEKMNEMNLECKKGISRRMIEILNHTSMPLTEIGRILDINPPTFSHIKKEKYFSYIGKRLWIVLQDITNNIIEIGRFTITDRRVNPVVIHHPDLTEIHGGGKTIEKPVEEKESFQHQGGEIDDNVKKVSGEVDNAKQKTLFEEPEPDEKKMFKHFSDLLEPIFSDMEIVKYKIQGIEKNQKQLRNVTINTLEPIDLSFKIKIHIEILPEIDQ